MPLTAHPVINMLWIGPSLGLIERLSIQSFLRAGHPVHLHAYDDIIDVPAGVTLIDAPATVARDIMLSLRPTQTGSYALAADYFRFVLQQQGKGLWSDTDVVCLRPFDFAGETLFGWQSATHINTAVLRLPAPSGIAAEVLAAFSPNAIPFWIDPVRKRQLWMKRFVRRPFGAQDQWWGTFGPDALTALSRKHGQLAAAQPQSVFYPYRWDKAAVPFAPATCVDAFIAADTRAMHLWNENLGTLRHTRPPRTSAIGSLMRDFGV